MRKLTRIAAILSLLVAGSQAVAKPLRLDARDPLTRYVVDAWRDTTGLPVDSVAAIEQTRDGYLWVGTEHGLARFDGVRFTVFTPRTAPAFHSEEITSLLAARNGMLWIGTHGGGIVIWDGQTFTRAPVTLRFIAGFAESPDGSIWMAAPAAMYRWRDGKYDRYDKTTGYPGGRILAMAGDSDGGVWLSTAGKLIRMGGRSPLLTIDVKTSVTALSSGPEGLLAGDESGTVYRVSGAKLEPIFSTPRPYPVRSIHRGDRKSIWISTNGGGVVRYTLGKVESLDSRNGLTSDAIGQIFEDAEGNLWAASIGGGLMRIKQPRIANYVPPAPLGAEWVTALAEARDGSLWIGTDSGGVSHVSGNRLIRYSRAEGLISNGVYAIEEGPDGEIWIGTDSGLQRVRNGEIDWTITPKEGLKGSVAAGLTVARDGSLWVGTELGVLHHIVDGKIVAVMSPKEGPLKGYAGPTREAKDGSLWIATTAGVEHMVGGRVVSTVGRDAGFTSKRSASMTLDEKDGSIWIATRGDGLFRVRDGVARRYRVTDGLLDDSIYTIVLDRRGDPWISTSRGLFTAPRQAFDAYDGRKISRIPITVYRKSDGMRSSDFSGGIDKPGFRARDGKLWFPTTRGIIIVDPDELRSNPIPPAVVVQNVVADGVDYGPDARLDLSPEKRQLEISYTAPVFYAPERLSFRYRLIGFDDEWRDAGTRRTAYYTNVPPGRYRFVVRADTGEGTTGEASTTVVVEPRIYERPMFRLALILAFLLLLLVLHRRRLASLQAHQAELEASEEHFRSLIENGSDLILVIDLDGYIRYTSPSVERMLGFDPRDVTSQPLTRFLASDSMSAPGELWQKHAATLVVVDREGTRHELDAVAAIGEQAGTLIVNCRDITDRRRLEAQLEQANRVASLGRLAATVSHEFNNVLMGIQPFVDVIRRGVDPHRTAHATAQITRSIKRGKHISEEILRYTRPAVPTLRPIPAREWLAEIELEIRALVGDATRVAVIAPEGLTISADTAQLNQVVTNLAINARDAGASSIRIEARASSGNGVYPFGIVRGVDRFAHISVTDNGNGIPSAIQAKIFEPLFTTKTTRGTGLGLAVAHQIVCRHGGEIFVESKLGSGTKFHLFIPIATSEGGELLRGEEPVIPLQTTSCRILLVEDDSTVAEGILATLEIEGFEVRLAVNGGEALSIIPRYAPDVVILDVGLPDIDGIDLFKIISSKWPGIRTIFSTGHGDVGALAETMPAPHPPFLLKPYSIDALTSAIAQAMEQERSVA